MWQDVTLFFCFLIFRGSGYLTIHYIILYVFLYV